MLINKWLIAESFAEMKDTQLPIALLLALDKEPVEISELYNTLQKMPQRSFSILLSGGHAPPKKISDTYIEKIIGTFFQPCYYLDNYHPVLFLDGTSLASTSFCSRLIEKCKMQGFQILMLEVKNRQGDFETNQFVYKLPSGYINCDAIVENWLCQYLEKKNPSEIHLLLSETQRASTDIINVEQSLTQQESYKIANLFHEKQKLIEEYEHELHLGKIAEESAQLYLTMQKEQTLTNVDWYFREYEILPGWYKKFGHLIKVLTGKRTFRSLFSNNAKKYKH
jgi:hypothetical protein